MEKIIGIDLGTTNSCVAVMRGEDDIVVIQNEEGTRTTPSVVAFKDDEIYVGQIAKNQAAVNPDTIVSIKTHMGTRHKEKLTNKKVYTPQEISAMTLQKMKKIAEDYLEEEVTRAVITVPAYFTDAQRQATKDAGTIAGLKVERIISEPTAAALSYGIDKKDINLTVLVFDLGGGTFDVSVMKINNGSFDVLVTEGDSRLGGDDFDQKVMDYIVETLKKEHKYNPTKDKQAMQRIKEAAERAKKDLSGLPEAMISLPFIGMTDTGPINLDMSITKSKFDELTSDLVKRTIKIVQKAMKGARKKLGDSPIDKVLLVGGSTRIPAVQQAVRTEIGVEPSKGINPDEAVAMGAAIQAGIISGIIDDITLTDATPMSLGIKTGAKMAVLIEKDTPLPAIKTQVFTTTKDNQEFVKITVLQGEEDTAVSNEELGSFNLEGIEEADAGVPRIDVEFQVDENNILQVSATNRATGEKQEIKIESVNRLEDGDLQRMVEEAEENANMSRKKKKALGLRNDAEDLLRELEEALALLEISAPQDVQVAKVHVKDFLNDPKKLKGAYKELEKASKGIFADAKAKQAELDAAEDEAEEEETTEE